MRSSLSLRQGRCKLSLVGHPCEVGLRRRTYHILAGSVLGVWTQLEGVFLRHGGHNSRMQIARVRMPTKRLVGECSFTPELYVYSSALEFLPHTVFLLELPSCT